MKDHLELHFDGRVPPDVRVALLDNEQNHPHGLHVMPLSGRSFLLRARRSWKPESFRRALGRRLNEIGFKHYQEHGTHMPTFEVDQHTPKTSTTWPGAELDFTESGGLPLKIANQLIAALGDYSYVERIDIDRLDTVVYVIVVAFRGNQHFSSDAPTQAFLQAATRDWLDENGHEHTEFTTRAPRG